MGKTKTSILLETFCIIAITISLLSLPVLAYRANNFEDGGHFANMLAPILSFVGSVLVYLAFKAQIKANSQIQEQFQKQNYDQNFFRLIDNIQNRITNSEIQRLKSEKIEKGLGIFDYIVEEIAKKAQNSSNLFGEKILITNPECLNDEIWKKFFAEADGNKYKDFKILKKKFLNADQESRHKILDEDIYQEYNEEYESLLKEIFMKYFYLQSEEYYSIYYAHLSKPYLDKYIVFFDSYYRSISMILKHIDSIKDNQFYSDYFIDNLTTHEKIMIWVAVAARRFRKESRERIKKISLLDSISDIKGIRVAPTNEYGKHIALQLG